MKQRLPLKTIEYNVPSPSGASSLRYRDNFLRRDDRSHLLNVQIDFQSGLLQLEGNWDFIIASNSQAERHWFGFHRGRVGFKATLFPGQSLDLEEISGGTAFAVEGKLYDSDGEIEYTGLLLMDPAKDNKTPGTKCWSVSLYLYNSEADECEIKLKWFFYPTAEFAELN